MRNKILVIGGIALLAYVLGSRASRGTRPESVGHQAVRLWTDPKAKKTRRKSAAKLSKETRRRGKKLTRTTKKMSKRAAAAAKSTSHAITKKLS